MSIKDDLSRSLDRLNLEERQLLDQPDAYVSGWNAALDSAAAIAKIWNRADLSGLILRLKLDKE